MTDENQATLDALVQARIDADSEFASTLETLSDEEKESALVAKKAELANAIFVETHSKLKKDSELAQNYKVRAEKAERELKGKVGDTVVTPPAGTQSEQDLSSEDVFALMEAKVNKDDLPEIKHAAKVLGKKVGEVLNDPIVQGIITRNAEGRKAQKAANDGKAKPGTKSVTSDEILRKASEGEYPKPGSKEAEDLFWAKRGGKRN